MIVPMLKYTILCHHLEYNNFLDKLYELGLVHIIEKNKEEVESYKQNKLNIQLFEKSLRKIAEKRNIEKPVEGEIDPELDVLLYVQEMEEKIAEFEKKKENLDKDISFYNSWDNFNLESISKLNELNISVKFYECSIKKFKNEWLESYPIEIIKKDKNQVNFICLIHNNEEIEIPAKEIEIPVNPLDKIKQDINIVDTEIEKLNNELNVNIAKALFILDDQVNKDNRELDYRFVKANTSRITDEKVILFEGWVPKTKVKKLNQFFEEEDIVYYTEEPGKYDNVPILLKNNKFSRLFEPIGDLFSLPDYQEIDLTPFFAPFFMLFFGFCVGDTGYGLLILIATLILRRKANEKMKPILTLASFLGAATVLMGLVSGTLFGVDLMKVDFYPDSLKNIIQDPLKLFWISIGLGGIQVVYGMCIKAVNLIKQNGIKYGLSTIGWISIIITGGIFATYSGDSSLIALILKILMIISGALILLFANPEKNIIISMFSGLYDVYNVVTGVFGDLLSYIRLFALGISSAILGLVFNQIASQFLGMGLAGWPLFIIILLIGHGLNIFLASLGAFVHPLRLTFVEFYKNAGFTGGGKQYKPFSKTEN